MYSAPSLFSRGSLTPISASACSMEQTESSTMREPTFLLLKLMLAQWYSAAKVARIGVGYFYDRISGSRATLA